MKRYTGALVAVAALLCQYAAAQPLMDKMTTDAGTVKMFKYAELRTWAFQLPNGVLLVMRPDDSVKNVLISGFAPGGAAGMPDADYASAIHAGAIMARSGVGKYDAAALEGLLKNTKIRLTPNISDNSSSISGSCSKEDLETALQLIYLYFTAPRRDADACRGYTEQLKQAAAAQRPDPVEDTINLLRYGRNIRHSRDLLKEAESISPDKVIDAWTKCFGNARGYTFVLTGDLDPNGMNHSRLEPLVDRYLGALPSKQTAERPPQEGIAIPSATIDKVIRAGHDSIAHGSIIFSGSYHYSDSANLQLKALAWILRQRWVDDITGDGLRLKGANTSTRTEKMPGQRYEYRINFMCPAAQAPAILRRLHEVMDSLQTGPDDSYLERYVTLQKDMLRKQFSDNGFWTTYLVRAFMKQDDPYDIAHYPYYFRKATPETIRQTARLFWQNKPFIQVVQLPAAQ